jgi:excisionase family DNA binding protein
MTAQIGAPAACKLTGATDEPLTGCLSINDNTYNTLLGSYPPIGTLEQAASILQIPVTTARQMCREGRLPACKVGQRWRIPRAWLEEYMRGGGSHE